MDTTITVSVSLEVYLRLAALGDEQQLIAEIAQRILEDAADLGTPATLHATARLATQTADTLMERWLERREALRQLAAALEEIAQGL